MKNLITTYQGQAVTTSLQIAQDFDKRHDHTLQDIKKLTTENPGVKNMFFESQYTNERGRQYPMYYMNRDGFTLLAMGFTGNKALQFKLDYINAFNQMEQNMQKNLPTDPVALALQAALDTRQEVQDIKQDVQDLKENMRINTYQEKLLQDMAKQRVMKALGGYQSPAYQAMSKKVFPAIWRDFKNKFNLPTYRALQVTQMEAAKFFISIWEPSASLKYDIAVYNRQLKIEDVEQNLDHIQIGKG